MVKVVVNMNIEPGNFDTMNAAMKELVTLTVVEEGCISYNFCRKIEGENSYAILETWESQAALDAHLQSEHFLRIFPILSAHVTGEMEIATFDIIL